MRDAKVDTNHNQIVVALRGMGASVTSLAAVGLGVPDLVVGWRRQNFLLEVKSEKGQLNPYQKAFHAMWNGRVAVVRTPDEALAAIGAITLAAGRPGLDPARETQTDQYAVEGDRDEGDK